MPQVSEQKATRQGSIPVLDHGYVRLIETWGRGDAGEAEAGIVEAARQSTQGSFRGWDKDEKLLRFLYTARPPHATPFEFAGMVVEVQAPIAVFREWHRHRVQSFEETVWGIDNLDDTGYNEMSARYAPLPDLNYVPTVERCLAVSATNKQAGAVTGSEPITKGSASEWLVELAMAYDDCEKVYQSGLNRGVPKELARMVLPVGRYSRMRASTNLRNWLAFLTLRMDPAAQWEIRQYAEALGSIIAREFPRTWKLFEEGRSN